MNLALIPPKGYESYVQRGSAVMVLAQIGLWQYEDEHTQMVKTNPTLPSMIDNGANEGQTVTTQLLMERAARYGVREIVVPDELDSRDRTIQKARHFWTTLVNSPYAYTSYDYMGVAQGSTKLEVETCIESFSKLGFVKTIGIPRRLIRRTGNSIIRIELARTIRQRYGNRFQIHFLGMSPHWLGEIAFATQEVPFVRSVDTSAPFVYAMEGKKIHRQAEPIHRRPNYFDDMQVINEDLLQDNIRVLKRWVNG